MLNKIKMSQLSDKLMEGKICELVTWQEELLIVHLLTCLVTSSQRNKNPRKQGLDVLRLQPRKHVLFKTLFLLAPFFLQIIDYANKKYVSM